MKMNKYLRIHHIYSSAHNREDHILGRFTTNKLRDNLDHNKNNVIRDFWSGGGGSGSGRPGRGASGDGDYSAENIDPNITLASVGGLHEHINYLLLSVMYPLKHGEALKEWGLEPPKGIMFHG